MSCLKECFCLPRGLRPCSLAQPMEGLQNKANHVQVSFFPGGNTLHTLSHIAVGRSQCCLHSCTVPVWAGQQEAHTQGSPDLLSAPFPLADLGQHPSAIINHNCDIAPFTAFCESFQRIIKPELFNNQAGSIPGMEGWANR